MSEYTTIYTTSSPLSLDSLVILPYPRFRELVLSLMEDEAVHCVNYFALAREEGLLFLCFLANDLTRSIDLLAHAHRGSLPSLSAVVPAMQVFEREIHENHGVLFTDHPWLKPLRYAANRVNPAALMDNYPFYSIESEELHEVGVGPVHAGVIEPGHFRFQCKGETVLHLEIQLGYQHRGLETLMGKGATGLRRSLLAESIAGDTVIGHATSHAEVMESLGGMEIPEALSLERAIALELERIAVHIGDSAALCTDIAYQLGQVVFESLRTTVINTTQLWCGNRFGKALIRPGGTHFPLTRDVADQVRKNLNEVMLRFLPMSDRLITLPSALARYDGIGVISRAQLSSIGAVGMAARAGGLRRDIRASHPGLPWLDSPLNPVVLENGDVMARLMLRRMEVEVSWDRVQTWLRHFPYGKQPVQLPCYQKALLPRALAISLAEGWRGEICHVGLTDEHGQLAHYKIKDPSLHNWMALALAVRNQEISDFPVCNKSFNLSYCGHDL